MEKERVGIYGGSFNPVHYGHVNVAKRAIEDLRLDRLVVVPANVSPFKTDSAKSPLWDRLELVRAAFAGVEKAVVDECEIVRGGVSYTIDTVRDIIARDASSSPREREYFFIIGEDSLAGLPKWKDIEELKKLVAFKAYPRTPESSTEIRELFERNAVTINGDEAIARAVRNGIVRKNGFCPCRLQKLPEFFCPCDEFKGQLRDESFHGLCHCRLYLKP